MSRNDLLKELNERSIKLSEEYEDFKKLPDNQKNENKEKLFNELAETWVSISHTLLELDEFESTIAPDQCYQLEKAFVTRTYKDYLALLIKDHIIIPRDGDHIIIGSGKVDERSEQSYKQSRRNSQQDDSQLEQQYRIFSNKQSIRADAIKKALLDVLKKSDAQQLTAAYCRLKSNSINELWQRMQMADEEFELDRKYLTRNYAEDIEVMGIEIENTLLILQEELEKSNGQNGRQNDSLKLQRVTIPKFAGDYFKWVTFRDLFTKMIVENKSMSNAERMQMLKTNLVVDSEAELLVRDLGVSDVNFECAWDRLTGRYNNNRVVVFKYMTRLSNQSIAAYEAKAIRKLLDTTDQILLALKNLKRPVEHWDDWIVFNISQKLSEEARKDWEKEIGSSAELPTWNLLKEFLEKEFRMLEGVENTKKSKHQDKKGTDKTSSNGIVKSYQASIENEKYPCPACNEAHGLFSCATFKTMEVQERWGLAKSKHLCFACL